MKAYRPHLVSRAERLAFRLKDDKPVIQHKTVRRKRRNNALLLHERQPMHYWLMNGKPLKSEKIKAKQYTREDHPVRIEGEI